MSLFVALFLGLFHWLRGGSYWLDDEQVIYRSPGRHDVIKLKGLSIRLGAGENSQARYIEWKWPGGGRWLFLPEDRGSAWINTFAFLCNLQRMGASIDGLGFGRQTVAAGSRAKVSVGGQSWNLLFITLMVLLMPVWRMSGADLLSGLVCNIPLMLALVARWLPTLPFQGEMAWTAESVLMKKVWRTLWELPVSDFRALVIERKKVWTGYERARLSLVTHYGRILPVSPWTKCLGKPELTIIDLARGAGLEICIEGEHGLLAKSKFEPSVQEATAQETETESGGEEVILPQTFM